MKNFKKFACIALIAILTLALAACGQNDETADSMDDEVITSGTIVVGICNDYPPFESLNTDGDLEGFDVDMANWLAEHLTTESGETYNIEFSQMDFSTIISALQTKQVDVGIAAFSYDPDRECLFTDPYYDSAAVIVVKEGSEISGVDDLANKKVGAGAGTSAYAAIEDIEGIDLVNSDDYLQQFEMLRVGQIDAVVCDETVAEGFVDNNSEFVILDEHVVDDELCVTVAKGNTNLQAALNDAIAEFIDSGAADELKEKWGL